jgi:hypothetical protein
MSLVNWSVTVLQIRARVAMLESSLTLWLPKLGLCICWYSLSATIIKNAAPHPNPTIYVRNSIDIQE